MAVPSEFKYSKEHEWVKVEGNTATIGITEYAQGELEHRICRITRCR